MPKGVKLLRPRPCANCGAVFMSRKKSTRFCSQPCVWKAVKGLAFNASIAKSSASARGDAQRGNGNGVSYRKLNGRHEHRVMAERKIGRSLVRGEIVHHIDGNILNNSLENLEVMTQSRHAQIHFLEFWKQKKAANNERR